MDRLKKFFFVAVLLLSCKQILFAQNNISQNELNEIDKNLNEAIFINTNSNSFLTGETLLYKISCVNKTTNMPSKYSKVAYFDIVDSERKTVVSQKIFLENGNGSGDFFIPTTLETGTYKIIGYTRWMLNKNIESFFTTDLFIINPYQEKATSLETTATSASYEPLRDNNISFDLKSKNFSTRNPVEVQINTNSDDYRKGNYTISVRKTDGFASQNKLSYTEYKSDNSKTDLENNFISNQNFLLPELRGEIITGRIKSASDVKNKKVALSIVGKNYAFKIVKTDEQGRFSFNLEAANSNKNIVIQILEENKENYITEIEIDKPKEKDLSKLNFSAIKLHSESNRNIVERLVSSQIENAYYNKKRDSLLAPNTPVPFYGATAKEYRFDDFTRFPTMEETITEIITGVVFRKDNGKYRILIYDFDKNYESPLPPLIVVDGLILEDLNDFFKYNPKNLDKVNVIKGPYYYGAKSYNGLLCFATKKGDYETTSNSGLIIKPEILRPTDKKEYFNPKYPNSADSRIPDYRHQLLWSSNPDLSRKDVPIQFYTSDVSGKFEITLEGFSATGAPVYIKDYIDVSDNATN